MFIPRPVAFAIAIASGSLAVAVAATHRHPISTPVMAAVPVVNIPKPASTLRQMSDDDAQPATTLTPQLTKDQAIDAAAQFCNKIGIKITQPFDGEFVGVDRLGDMVPTYWKPVWKLKSGHVEVNVDDTDGSITHLMAMDDGAPDPPAGKAISKEQATTIVENVLNAARVPDELGAPQGQENQDAYPATRSSHDWDFFWPRRAQGYNFRDQHAAVFLNAETGVPITMGVIFLTPAPSPVTPVFTSAQAVDTAKKLLESNPRKPGVTWTSTGPAQLFWTTPTVPGHTPAINGVVDHKPAPIPDMTLPPVLAWYCYLRSNDGLAIVPVDSVSGKVVDSDIGFADPPMRPRPSTRPTERAILPPPKPVVIDHDIVATTIPPDQPEQVHTTGFRVHLADIYAPISVIAAMNVGEPGELLDVDETNAPDITAKLLAAVKQGKLRLVDGPTAIIPKGGLWGILRTRPVVCHEPIFWDPRPVPDTIEMKLVIGPIGDNDGEIVTSSDIGTKALAKGQAMVDDDDFDRASDNGSGFGHEGQWSVLGSLNEEEYAYETGKPGEIKEEGVIHIVLFKVDKA